MNYACSLRCLALYIWSNQIFITLAVWRPSGLQVADTHLGLAPGQHNSGIEPLATLFAIWPGGEPNTGPPAQTAMSSTANIP